MIGSRTRSREIALQVLYSLDVHRAPDEAHVDFMLGDTEASAEVKSFARQLALGVLERRAEIDGLIVGAIENWDLSRLATVDRNVLRLGIFEMLALPDVPPKVAINEAIELGKRFSTAQSGAFVNGILDRVRKDLGLPAEGRDKVPAPEPG